MATVLEDLRFYNAEVVLQFIVIFYFCHVVLILRDSYGFPIGLWMGNSHQSSHTCIGKLQREQMGRNTEETDQKKWSTGTDQREQSGRTVKQ